MISKTKKYVVYFSLSLTILILLALFILKEDEIMIIKEECQEIVECDVIELKIDEYIRADVKGEVENPGVYKMKEGSRVKDFIDAAGGVTNDADLININLSKIVNDQDIIYIFDQDFFKEEVIIEEIIIVKDCICPDVTFDNTVDKKEEVKLININKATLDVLVTLPGIGEARANDIIEYRKKQEFESIEDIKNISGIGEASFDNIKTLITI